MLCQGLGFRVRDLEKVGLAQRAEGGVEENAKSVKARGIVLLPPTNQQFCAKLLAWFLAEKYDRDYKHILFVASFVTAC